MNETASGKSHIKVVLARSLETYAVIAYVLKKKALSLGVDVNGPTSVTLQKLIKSCIPASTM